MAHSYTTEQTNTYTSETLEEIAVAAMSAEQRGEKTFNSYIVETEYRPGWRTVLYKGENRQIAVDKTNFWDERQNTWFIDVKQKACFERERQKNLSALDWANERFDALEKRIAAA